MLQKLDKILLWILHSGLVLILFSVLIKNESVFFPYIVPRTTYLQFITELIFFISVLFIVLYPAYRPKWTFFSSALSAFFAAGLISVVFSADPSKSMFGTMERAFGFFNILHYGMIFFIATVALRTQKQWNVFLAASILISLYAAIDLLSSFMSTGRVPPTVAGNPTFLSAYLIFHIFFSAFLFTQIKNKYLKIFLGIILAVQILAVIASGVRGGFVGLSLSALFLAVYSIIKHQKTRTVTAGILITLILLYGYIFINRFEPQINTNPILQRITNFSSEDETIKARFAMWRIAWRGILDRPITGWGRENYSLVFNKYFDQSFEEAHVSELWEDRTHNIVFDELINGGILEFLAYAFLLGITFAYVRKNPLFMALLIAYTAQNFFGVDTLNSYLPFFLFIGMLNAKSSLDRSGEISNFEYKKPDLKSVAFIFAAFLIAASGIFFNIESARGNAKIYKSLLAMARSDYPAFQKSYAEGKNILRFFPYIESESLTLFASLVSRQSADFSRIANYPDYIAQLTTDLDRAYLRNKLEHRVGLNFVGLLLNNAILDKTYIDKAEEILRELMKTSPDRRVFMDTMLSTKQIRAYLEQNHNKK